MTLGVHFAIDAQTAGRLRTAADDDAVAALIEEIEERGLGTKEADYCETDKAWDAIHRSLTDGRLATDNGTYPLNAAVLGGFQVHENEDYLVSLLEPAEVRDVAAALAPITRAVLEAGYRRIDAADYGPEFGDEDFAYTWSNFEDLQGFFRRSAADGRHVVFTVGL